ncbi:MAG TPA: acetyl-CoA C-acyltransferase FadI [Longimicrobiales bacterium]|nr:acetyl-CoA C-acyltransferase FadI [Longimicrobiales bacterium]
MNRVAVVAGCRTPFARAGSAFADISPVELGTVAVRELLQRAELDPGEVDELVYGTVVPSIQAPNVAREVGLAAGLPARVPAFTVSRACASANQAITSAADIIERGHGGVVVAGGVEILSDVPMLLSKRLRNALLAASKSKSLRGRVRALAGIRPRDLAPTVPAIAEPSTGESMGQSAERMAKENGISREAQDRWALRSHQLAAQGLQDGRLREEIVPVFLPPRYEQVLDTDNGVRADTSLDRLATLKPVFDRRYGSVTAGNASPLTDGASAVLLMSETRAKSLGCEPLGYLRSWAYAALDPGDQLLQGPAYAVPVALERAGITMKDVELWEMHEAFAAQVLSNMQALDSSSFAREKLNRAEKVGLPDESVINVMGGSIALGHPFGATGARLLTTCLSEMRRRGAGIGLISVCAAGGMGFAMVVDR